MRDCLKAGKLDAIRAHLAEAHRTQTLPTALHQLTLQCLEYQAELRPQNASEVAERIEAFFKSEAEDLQRLQVRTARQQVVRFSLAVVAIILVFASVFSVAFGIRRLSRGSVPSETFNSGLMRWMQSCH